jgi:MSHA biogenesis protein MshM
MRQLNQRISFSCTLSPLSFAATAGYIYHRLRVADCRSELQFTDAAIRRICKSSQGIPRIINVLCHKTLMVAYGRGEQRVTQAHVERAIEDTQSILPSTSWRNPFATMRGMLFPPPRLGSGLNALHGVEQ